VTKCGSGFLHEVGDLLGGERVCVSHYMKDNVHERLEVQRPNWPKEHTVSCWKIDLEIQPENVFQVIWSPKGIRGALITADGW